MKFVRFFIVPVLSLILILSSSGCGLIAPIVGSVKSAGLTASDRRAILPQELKKYSQARYWGSLDELYPMLADESRAALMKRFREAKKREERVIETKIDVVDFGEGSSTATVELVVRAYRAPFYIVQDYPERQKWEFSVSKGWQLISVEDA